MRCGEGTFSTGKEIETVSTRRIKPLAVIGGSAVITAAALAGAILQGPSGSSAIAGSEMSTGVTVTATTAPTGVPIPVAQPSIKGPAPLPPEEQGLPG
jgi:hypothetical protein